ncbi:MAG TPA: hypothetical protein GX715_09435 [Armatimonadetes bacterium]|jgi:hypothetical protein|nr:hypothetical protein [Armatimonadota bacterium]
MVSIAAGAVILVLVGLLVRHTEIITGRYLSSGVPPVLAFAGLLLFLGARPLLRRIHPRLCPSRSQALLLYMMLTIGVWLSGAYGVRAFLPHLVALQYWSQSDANLAPYPGELPEWYAPRDAEAARAYFEGSRDGQVPWGVWLPVLLRWIPFMLALFGGAFCLMLLMRRQWLHSERLTFPLLYLPLSLASEGGSRFTGDGKPLLRSPILWAGISIAVLFNVLNIAHALIPTVPAPKFSYSLAPHFPNRPWTPLRSITLFYMLEAIGFGYFVPLEISFSAWFLYLAEKAFAVAGTAAGYDKPGYPFIQEQCAGAYLACGLMLVWGARRHLGAMWRRAWTHAGEERVAWIGLGVCSVVVVGWAVAAGLALEVAIPYFLVLGCFVLVYARIRAETGVPLEFIYPYGLPKEMVLNALTVPGITGMGGVRSMVIFSSLAWLARHHMTETLAAYQIDSLKLNDQERIGRRKLAVALGVAFAIGLGAAVWAHLDGYYQIGSNAASGGMGEYRATVARQEYQQMASRIAAPPQRDWTRITANASGFGIASALAAVRARVPGFPLHPLGFLLATAYGDHTTCFFPLFVAWLAKLIILKAGGLKLYRRGIPFFLGLIIGHFTLAGILWPLLSMLISPEASRSYHIFFGG